MKKAIIRHIIGGMLTFLLLLLLVPVLIMAPLIGMLIYANLLLALIILEIKGKDGHL